MREGKEILTKIDFGVLKEYINTGSTSSLSEETRRMLDIAISCYGMQRNYPQRNICIKKLMALYKYDDMSYNTAAQYVDFVRSTWGSYIDVSRDFLETFFIDRLLSEITNPNNREDTRCKNLATLQKYISEKRDENVDPRLMEQNNVFIQFNVGDKNFTLPEKVLSALPAEYRQELMDSVGDGISENKAKEIMES